MTDVTARTFRDLVEARRQALQSSSVQFRDANVTALGRKVVRGYFTDEPAVQFYVDKKRPISDVPLQQRIPRSIDGIATDVVPFAGDVRLDGLAIPSSMTPFVSAGGAVWGQGNTYGTTSIVARSASGKRLLITAAHVLPNAGVVRYGSTARRVGRVRSHINGLPGAKIYPPGHPHAQRTVKLDVAVSELDSAVRASENIGGRPGGLVFTPKDHNSLAWRIYDNPTLPMICYGATTRTWRSSVAVRGLYQVNRDTGEGGFLLIQQATASKPGDSGGAWLLQEPGRGYIVVAMHSGVEAGMSWATDLPTALSQLQIETSGGRT